MKALFAVPLLLCAGVQAQVLSPVEQKEILEKSRLLYASPVAKGMLGFSCQVKFDFDSLPKTYLASVTEDGRKALEETMVVASVLKRSPTEVEYKLPGTVPVSVKPAYDTLFKNVSGFAKSLLDAWAAKGMEGPLPEDAMVQSVMKGSSGYEIKLKRSGDEPLLRLDAEGKATHYTAQDLDETFIYEPSPQGLLLTADESAVGAGRFITRMAMKATYQTVGGFQIPHQIELKTNGDLPVKFALEQCTAPRGN